MKTLRLDRALSKLGLAFRSEAAALVRGGRVAVDGRRVVDPGLPVVPEKIRVEIDGRLLRRAQWLTIVLNKPRGVVATRRDPEGRPTVLDLVSDAPSRVSPVGRLDLATTGLLLLTNDNRFADWVTDPAKRVLRTYLVTVRGALTDPTLERLQAGIDVGGERLVAASARVRKKSGRETHLVIELIEGRNREIRRLLLAAGHEVTALKRVAFGGLTLGDLPPGKWRTVPASELRRAFPGAPVQEHKG